MIGRLCLGFLESIFIDRGQHRRNRTCKEEEKEVDDSKCGGVHDDYKDCKNTVCQGNYFSPILSRNNQ